jgi:hypothetical protein
MDIMEIQKVTNLFAKNAQAEDVDETDQVDDEEELDTQEDASSDQTEATAATAQQGDTVQVSQNEVTAETVQSIMQSKIASLKAKINDPKIDAELTKLLGNFDSEKFMKDYGSEIQTTAEATAILYYLYFDKYEEMGEQKKQ